MSVIDVCILNDPEVRRKCPKTGLPVGSPRFISYAGLNKSLRAAALPAVCCGAIMLLAGCGPSGPPRYQVSGSINYNGRPVPAGHVIFEPDAAQGNAGPAAYAKIQNGRYKTAADSGVVGGPMVVRINGRSGTGSPESPQGPLLFPREYRAKIELPKEDTTHDFEIPPFNPT